MKILILSILSLVSLVPAYGEHPEKTINQLLHDIRVEVPKGWIASYDKEYTWLEVTREEAVLCVSALPNASIGAKPEKPEQGTLTFAFRVVAAVDQTEYRRLSVANATIQKKIAALYQELVNKRVSYKFDEFWPGTKEEKSAVAEYEALKKSLHSLPDFYFGDISLEWGYNSPDNPIFSITDDQIRDECRRVSERVAKLLSKYEDASVQE